MYQTNLFKSLIDAMGTGRAANRNLRSPGTLQGYLCWEAMGEDHIGVDVVNGRGDSSRRAEMVHCTDVSSRQDDSAAVTQGYSTEI